MNSSGTKIFENLLDLIQLHKIGLILLSLVFVYLLVKSIRYLSSRLEKELNNQRLLILQVTTVMSFIISTFGLGFLVYGILSPPKELVMALGGSLAVALGFALKDLASSLIAGFLLLFERPFQVGDRIQYRDHYGEVIRIGLRTMRLQTLDDNLVTVPNAQFLTEAVACGNSGYLHMMVPISFHIDLEAQLDKAQEIIQEIVTTSRFVYLIKPVSMVMEEVELRYQLALKITVKAYVLDVKYEKDFQSDIVKRVSQSFLKHQIKRPSFKQPPIKGISCES